MTMSCDLLLYKTATKEKYENMKICWGLREAPKEDEQYAIRALY